ncbi:hypothetical protein [Brevundimonas sp.]|uniref:hypothetical protein n=1 Tax=Brevundimonas sp. TaxID=1871086 RepID=UPI0025C3AA89|nr:hypothetical protein [Brevundimonas sp.]
MTGEAALKPPEYGVNVDDSQSSLEAQQFVAPGQHRQDDQRLTGHDYRYSSCLYRIGLSHKDLDWIEPNGEKHNPGAQIVIALQRGIGTSCDDAAAGTRAAATALVNG